MQINRNKTCTTDTVIDVRHGYCVPQCALLPPAVMPHRSSSLCCAPLRLYTFTAASIVSTIQHSPPKFTEGRTQIIFCRRRREQRDALSRPKYYIQNSQPSSQPPRSFNSRAGSPCCPRKSHDLIHLSVYSNANT